MVIETKGFKEVCSSILSAIDNSELSNYTEALELVTKENYLYLNVTNKEYFASAKFKLEENEELHAVINANTFLKLVAAITTENIELKIRENYLLVKANGNYKFPLIFENNQLMVLPTIDIANETLSMNIGGDILNSILIYNSKVMSKQNTAPIQKLYYLDQEGCITFTTCVCVNNFKLEKPIKVLLNNKLVRLFKLFKDKLVKLHLGYDPLNENITQTKIKLVTPTLSLTAILPNDDLLVQFPSVQLRRLANKVYPQSAVLNVEKCLEALNRLKLLSKQDDIGSLKCNEDELTLKLNDNEEIIPTANGSVINEEYNTYINLTHLKSVLDTCEEQYITFNFGDNTSTTLVRGNIVNVIPEVKES